MSNQQRQSARAFEGRGKGRHRRNRHGPAEARERHIPLTDAGVPAATADAPTPSKAVSVSVESRARFPWLPPRVIAGSVWRGPNNERVKVDENGEARPWRSPLAAEPAVAR